MESIAAPKSYLVDRLEGCYAYKCSKSSQPVTSAKEHYGWVTRPTEARGRGSEDFTENLQQKFQTTGFVTYNLLVAPPIVGASTHRPSVVPT